MTDREKANLVKAIIDALSVQQDKRLDAELESLVSVMVARRMEMYANSVEDVLMNLIRQGKVRISITAQGVKR